MVKYGGRKFLLNSFKVEYGTGHQPPSENWEVCASELVYVHAMSDSYTWQTHYGFDLYWELVDDGCAVETTANPDNSTSSPSECENVDRIIGGQSIHEGNQGRKVRENDDVANHAKTLIFNKFCEKLSEF